MEFDTQIGLTFGAPWWGAEVARSLWAFVWINNPGFTLPQSTTLGWAQVGRPVSWDWCALSHSWNLYLPSSALCSCTFQSLTCHLNLPEHVMYRMHATRHVPANLMSDLLCLGFSAGPRTMNHQLDLPDRETSTQCELCQRTVRSCRDIKGAEGAYWWFLVALSIFLLEHFLVSILSPWQSFWDKQHWLVPTTLWL
jgi:hypothetical protein